jgi:hypothetical protein
VAIDDTVHAQLLSHTGTFMRVDRLESVKGMNFGGTFERHLFKLFVPILGVTVRDAWALVYWFVGLWI